MSFSSTVKEELIRADHGKGCCQLAELAALTMTSASLSFRGGGIGGLRLNFRFESAALARRVFLLLRERFATNPHLHFVQQRRMGIRRVCVLTLEGDAAQDFMVAMQMMTLDDLGEPTLRRTRPHITITRQCCRRAFLRGAYLGCGTMAAPEKEYHLEWVCDDDELVQTLSRTLEHAGLPARSHVRNGRSVVYMKGAQNVSDTLALMGASAAMLHCENIRIQKQMRSGANRASNCDSHNTERQVSAAQRQVEAMTRIAVTRGLYSLPPALRQAARLRMEHPDISLADLGQLMEPPVSKSGMNSRMRRLMAIAEELRAPGAPQEENP